MVKDPKGLEDPWGLAVFVVKNGTLPERVVEDYHGEYGQLWKM